MKISLNLAALVLVSQSPIVSAQKPAYKNSSLRGKGNGNPSKSKDKKTYIVSFKKDKSEGHFNERGGPANKRDGPASKCDALARVHGGSVGYIYDKVLNGCSMSLPPQAFDALRKNPNVALIEEDQEVSAASHNLFAAELSAESTTSTNIWGLDRIDQCNLPLDGFMTKQDASGVKVYILDTGIRGDHQDFDGVISTSDCHSDFAGEGNALSDRNGHGTHVASTTCGLKYGVSANCDLCAVKVLSGSGSGSNAGVIAGVNYVASNCDGNKCVANMSLGSRFSSALNNAVANAVDAGVTFVVAAGNDNKIACGYSPASEPKAITVGSTTITDGISWFSNYGTCVDVYAPGSSITAAWYTSPTATKSISGTSMASPHVAGIAAGILSGGAANSPAEVTAEIKRYASITGIDVRTPDAGLATVNCLKSPTNRPTPAPTHCTGKTLTVELKTDSYPRETSWTLTNTCTGTPVASKGDYASKNTLFTETMCDSAGDAEYRFTINDTYGDGLCCRYGSGSYKVKMNGVEQISGAAFTKTETNTFGSCAPVTPSPRPTKKPTNGVTYCGSESCTQQVWDTLAGDYSCGARISWLQSAQGESESAACAKVASEFPGLCLCDP